jgi:hypothetical protein
MSVDMKTKTSLSLDEKLWQDWQIYVIKITGTSRKASEKAEDALKEYMTNHPLTNSINKTEDK